MLSDLKFISGAVARKDYVEELCHFVIAGGRAGSHDGLLSMSTPIALELDVTPHARTMIKAVQACDDESAIALHVTAAGRLAIRSGSFRAYIGCLPNDTRVEQPQPEGDFMEVAPSLLDAIRTLAPFMSVDASRPWAQGIYIRENSAFATNNIILAEYWHGSAFPHDVIIPADAVTELLRVKQTPVAVQVSPSSATFHFEGERWIRTQLLDGTWPIEQLNAILGQGGSPLALTEEFFSALAKIRPFVDEHAGVRLYPDKVATTVEEQTGAVVEVAIAGGHGHFNINQLLLLQDIAHAVDWSTHPRPCYWQGKRMRGVIIGRND